MLSRPSAAECGLLAMRGASYDVPGRTLFADVDVTVAPGEGVAIVGPSGVGKSTLLAMLGGLLQPTRGQLLTPSTPTRYAFVLQTLNVLPARTVLSNAAVFAYLDGEQVAVTLDRASQLLDLLGLSDLATRRAKTLSGGELQRLVVTRALTSTRPVILADEPTNQLDATNAALVMRTMFESAVAESRALVVATHDMESLPEGCRVLILGRRGLSETPP